MIGTQFLAFKINSNSNCKIYLIIRYFSLDYPAVKKMQFCMSTVQSLPTKAAQKNCSNTRHFFVTTANLMHQWKRLLAEYTWYSVILQRDCNIFNFHYALYLELYLPLAGRHVSKQSSENTSQKDDAVFIACH